MSWLFWVGLAYLAGVVSAFVGLAAFHVGGDRKAEKDLEARELEKLNASGRKRRNGNPSAAWAFPVLLTEAQT